MADQILREVIAAQKDTLGLPDQVAIQAGDLLAVRSAEIAAIGWTLAGLDAFADPADSLAAWRDRLSDAAASAVHANQNPIPRPRTRFLRHPGQDEARAVPNSVAT